MPAIDPVEVAHALMLDAARAIPSRRVRSALTMASGRAGLSDEQFDALAERVQHVIQTADITIEPGAAS